MNKIKRIFQALKQLARVMRPGILSGSLAGIVSASLTGIAPGIVSAVSFSFFFCPYFWRASLRASGKNVSRSAGRASCKDTAGGIAPAAIRVQTVHRARLV